MSKDKRGKEKVRVSLDLSPEVFVRLEDLEDLTGVGSKAAVLRQALQLYEFVVHRAVDGWKFEASKGGEKENLVFLGGVPPSEKYS